MNADIYGRGVIGQRRRVEKVVAATKQQYDQAIGENIRGGLFGAIGYHIGGDRGSQVGAAVDGVTFSFSGVQGGNGYLSRPNRPTTEPGVPAMEAPTTEVPQTFSTGNSSTASYRNSANTAPVQRIILYHYTNAEGQKGIIASKTLNPSLKAINPSDARYGDGQYLSDIVPSTAWPAKLSASFIRNPYQGKWFTHYVAIDVTGLNVVKGRDGVYVIPNASSLNLQNRIVGSGQVPAKKPTNP